MFWIKPVGSQSCIFTPAPWANIACSEQHMIKNLTNVFELLRKNNLKLHPKKFSFFMHKVTFLGHNCTNKGILPDDKKNKMSLWITQSHMKRTVLDVLLHFAIIIDVLTKSSSTYNISKLCKKKVPFEWTNKCHNEFQYLKRKLMEPTLLQYHDLSKEFCIITYASKQACGAGLTQNHNGLQLPIAYASRAFTKGGSNESTTE